MNQPTKLVLQNGSIYQGFSFSKKSICGEVVFSTGLTGYVESLTDPSYTGQILVFTYPLIGNYGVPDKKRWESARVQPLAVVIGQTTENYSHHTALVSLQTLLNHFNVPLLTGVDTRALTLELREHGTMLGTLNARGKIKWAKPDANLVAVVTPEKSVVYGSSPKKIILVDCGLKENILRSLKKFPLTIKRVPFVYDYTAEKFDGIFISNGPGDPADCTQTIAILKKALTLKKPIFGICLGSQLLALAAGAKTYKLPYGHRGHNQPCLEVATGRAFVTSQNHGYAVDGDTIPADWKVSFKNLNDNSVEGIAHKTLPFFSVQFHPEACPGPTDTAWLFDKFFQTL